MIKGIGILRSVPGTDAHKRLASFFSALGFASGRGWGEPQGSAENASDSSDRKSTGASFLAPLGNLELIDGEMPPFAGLVIEVTSIDAAHQAATAWFRSQNLDSESLISPITETHWKARCFTVEPEPGHSFSFWSWIDPLKGKPVAIEGDLNARGMKFAIVVARWNAVITDRLLEGALDALLRSGAQRTDIQIVRVPGAWEIPAAARNIANLAVQGAPHVDAILALGCLLRGETAHYEAIYNEVSRGIGQSQQETGIPHAFGVLTCETLEQALNRAGIKAGNKGFEAAAAAIEMVSLRRKLLEGGAE